MNAAIILSLKEKGSKPTGSKKTKKPPQFIINIKELIEALEAGYLGLGTPYAPIQVDNFVNLENQEYASIYPNTQITAQLSYNAPNSPLKSMQFVCCKVNNVDREHNDDLKGNPGNPWANIFKLKGKSGKRIRTIYPAPDGTLYVAPNKNGKCRISTCKQLPDTLLAYSMIFSATLEMDKQQGPKSYYFVLDPVIKVSSRNR